MLDLKLEVATTVGLEIGEIVFRRGGAHGTELLEDSESLKAAQFYNNMSVYLEKGIPSQVGQKRVVLFLARPSQALLSNVNPEAEPAIIPDNSFFSFEELMEIPVKTAIKTAAVKQRVVEAVSAKFPELGLATIDQRRIRLREKIGEDKLTQVYHEQRELGRY